MKTSIAFIGGGNMARSIIGGLLQQGFEKSHISVSEPYPATRMALAEEPTFSGPANRSCKSGNWSKTPSKLYACQTNPSRHRAAPRHWLRS